jgi:histone-lysine N-methyltransferase SETD3
LSFTLTRASHIQALAAADERAAALASEWASLAQLLEAAPAMYPPASWTQRAFGDALAVVLAHAVYLPSARCFALLPLASNVTRRSPGFTGDGGVSATLDYDPGSSAVVLLATSDLVAGQEVVAADAQQRNSAELLLSGCELGGPKGTTAFAGDTLTWTASLLSTDRLYSAKAATLEAAGLLPSEQSFPVCAELGMPTQLLTYLRMSRITDAAELMKVRFDQDGACCLGPLLTVCHACGYLTQTTHYACVIAIITPMNEYEVLQLMMGDCRERLAAYDGAMCLCHQHCRAYALSAARCKLPHNSFAPFLLPTQAGWKTR